MYVKSMKVMTMIQQFGINKTTFYVNQQRFGAFYDAKLRMTFTYKDTYTEMDV